MTWKQHFTSSVGKKVVMAFTGLFLIGFLVIHVYLNAQIFLPNGKEKFLAGAEFMGTNAVTRILEIGLVAGFILHIIQGLMLWAQNSKKRSAGRYQITAGNATSPWYSRSMGLLGTIVLLFLIIHTSHFWIPNRYHQFTTGHELNLYEEMQMVFQSPVVVALYVLGCLSLCFHLVHGFYSAFQTLGMGTSKYKSIIRATGIAFSIIVMIMFALMPIAFHFDILLGK